MMCQRSISQSSLRSFLTTIKVCNLFQLANLGHYCCVFVYILYVAKNYCCSFLFTLCSSSIVVNKFALLMETLEINLKKFHVQT